MRPISSNRVPEISRRRFLKRSPGALAVGSVAGGLSISRSAHAAGSETIRIGFVGCGNRGTGACKEAFSVDAPVKLVAVGDLFPKRIEVSLKNLRKYPEIDRRIDVPDERCFTGFDA